MIPVNIARFLNDNFDKVLVVSVPRFTDRHEKVKQRLQGLNFDFFWGADKQQIDFEAAKKDGTYDEAMTKKLQRMNKALSPGELACSLSHRYVYEAMIQNNWQKVLVLEDDVWPLTGNLSQLPAAINELPPTWDLVYLGYLRHEEVGFGLKYKQFVYKIGSALGMMKWNYTMVSNLLPKPYSPHLKKAGFHDCTHAYAVNLNAAKKMSVTQNPVVYRADDLLSATTLMGEISSFVTVPKFFDQEDWHTGEEGSKIKEGKIY
jgi:glycosyl transferase family 25